MDAHVIFYKSGYLQLQVADDGDDFCHVYDTPANRAMVVLTLLEGGNAIGWYGNDPDAWLEVEKTAGIRYLSLQVLPDCVAAFENGRTDRTKLWDNEIAFYEALLERQRG